jgi:hypothetical protein
MGRGGGAATGGDGADGGSVRQVAFVVSPEGKGCFPWEGDAERRWGGWTDVQRGGVLLQFSPARAWPYRLQRTEVMTTGFRERRSWRDDGFSE